jgi:hypothetical protein
VNPQPKPTRASRPRKPLRSRSPIARTSWMRRKAPRRLSDPRQNDDARRDWTAHQVCIGVGRIPGHRCTGRIEVAHEGRKPGLAIKCSDHQAVPACTGIHRDWTNHAGPFKGWSKERRREWMEPIVDAVEASYLSAGSRRGTR